VQSRLPKAKGELIDIPKSLSEVYRNLVALAAGLAVSISGGRFSSIRKLSSQTLDAVMVLGGSSLSAIYHRVFLKTII